MAGTESAPRPHSATAAYRADVTRILAGAGFPATAIEALLAFDLDHFQYLRRVRKGDVPRALVEEMAVGIEVSQFHALSAILRLRSGFGRAAPQEPTVGLLAEELCLDPSRASRIAADLVERGLVARSVSQQDGRRSILIPTEAGIALMQTFLAAKWQRMVHIFDGWSGDEIETFARLFARYNEGVQRSYPAEDAPGQGG